MLSFDTLPVLFYAIGLLILLFVSVSCIIYKKYSFLFYSFLMSFFYFRLPVMRLNRPINIDEGQLITQARTFWHNPIWFDSVDTSTVGPLNSYLIDAFHLLGFPFDYSTVHIIATILLIFIFVTLFSKIKDIYNDIVALYAVLPIMLLYTFSQHYDLNQYSSELLSILLLAILFYLIPFSETQVDKKHLFCFGVLFAIMPIAKLQALPVAGILFIYLCLRLFFVKKYLEMSIVFFGILATVLVCISIFVYWGVIDDIWTFYIYRNFSYSGGYPLYKSLLQFPVFLFESEVSFIILPVVLSCVVFYQHNLQYNTIQYNTIQYNTIQYNTIQYNTKWLYMYTINHISIRNYKARVYTCSLSAIFVFSYNFIISQITFLLYKV